MRIFLSFIAALVAAALMTAAFWIAGFNFDDRGEPALRAYIAALIAAAWGFGITLMATSKN